MVQRTQDGAEDDLEVLDRRQLARLDPVDHDVHELAGPPVLVSVLGEQRAVVVRDPLPGRSGRGCVA
ncbi:hypothetical protein ACIP3U_32940 [[Kitasatospora] papulosa]|uniref:hypothetical protein n=1 Tax=[Kitasatospora] papulosa TaxID=1464011 RepID=UPI003818799F